MLGIITATIVIGSLLSPVVAQTPAACRVYLPIVMKRTLPSDWPIPRPTPTPRVIPGNYPWSPIGYAHYYSPDGQRWCFYTDLTLSPAWPWTVSDLVMVLFQAYDTGGVVYENTDPHPADPSWVSPGGTTRIQWDAPAADVPGGIDAFWFLLRGR